MRTIKTILTLVMIFVVIPALGVVLVWHGRCDETIILDAPSPDQKFHAQMAYKDCGASQPVATLVRLLDVAGSRTSDNMLLIEGKSAVQPAWTNAGTLALAVPKGAKVVYRRHEWDGVNVTFAER